MVRSSLSLPRVVETLLLLVDQRLGDGTSERFLGSLCSTGYANELRKPMLSGAGEWLPASMDRIEYDRVSGLSIDGPKQHSTDIMLSVNFPGGSVEEIFSRFVRATSHANPIGDFREHPERYASILLGPRYFLFHGDGHCFALANLLSCLVDRLAGSAAEVRYMFTGDRSLIHTFVEWQNGRRNILDADQKTITEWDSRGPPFGMIYQLLGMAGAMVYETACAQGRHWVFSTRTHECFANSYDSSPRSPRIYQPSPTPEIISALFEDAKADHMEGVSLDVDDYGWKAPFRKALEGQKLLSQIDRPIRMTLPPAGRLVIGLDSEALPEEASLLPLVFFGRVPATILADIPQGGLLEFAVPELPWLICFPRSVEQVSINGHQFDTHPSGSFSVVGGSDLDRIVGEPAISGCTPIVVDGPPGTTVRVVLPFNALAFNGGAIRIAGDAVVSVSEPPGNPVRGGQPDQYARRHDH